MDFKEDSVTASIEETEAIFEFLAEKDILSGAEVKQRIEKLKAETKLTFRRPN